MDVLAIFALVQKGITVAQMLLAAGQEVTPALDAIKNLVTGAQTGTVTDQQLTDTEALLDQLVSDFNADLPPETPAKS